MRFLAKSPLAFKAFLSLALLLTASLDVLAAVKIERARLGAGATSVRVMRYGWSQFSCQIENSDSADRKVMLRIVSLEGQQINVFSETVDVPAKSVLLFRSQVLLENSERYGLEAFVDGRKLPASRDNEMLVKVSTSKTALFAILDDAQEGLGAFNQLPAFKEKAGVVQYSAASAPESRLQYEGVQAIILLKPAFSKLNARQIAAVKEYAARGGTLIFANPEGALAAQDSPFAEMLPSTPLKMKKIDALPALAKISPSFKGFANGQADALESVAKPESFDAVGDGSFSVVRCKRFGLGVCKLCSVSPSDVNFQDDKATWEAFLEKTLASPRLLPDASPFSGCLDQMTGFKTPSLGSVRAILGAYLLLLILLITTGFLMKRAGLAWAAAVALSLLATFAILQAAKSEAGKKGKLLTSVKIVFPLEGAASADSFCAYFSDKAISLDAAGRTPDVFFSGMIPNLNSFLPPGMAFGFSQQMDEERKIGSGKKNGNGNPLQFSKPIELKRDPAGISGLQSLNVAANSSRQFMAYESGCQGVALQKSPELAFGAAGLAFKWEVPAGMNVEKAFLALPGGALPLELDGQSLSLTSGRSLFQSDLIAKSLREALEAGYARQCPYVALLSSGAAAPMDCGGNPLKQGRSLTLIPVKSSFEKSFALPEQSFVFRAGESASRLAMDGNRLKSGYEVQGPGTLTFEFSMPAFVQPSAELDELSVRFAFTSGGNIKTQVSLMAKPAAPPAQPGKKAPPPPKPFAVKGVEREPGVFVFSKALLKDVVDQNAGTGLLQIEGVEKNPAMPESLKMRANKWTPLSLSVSAKASLPEGATPCQF